MKSVVEEILGTQIQLLSKHSKSIVETGIGTKELPELTNKIIALATLLDPELKSQSCNETPVPFVGHLSMSDLEELIQARREKLRRSAEETRRVYKHLQSLQDQSTPAK